jgi:hypothetical protein
MKRFLLQKLQPLFWAIYGNYAWDGNTRSSSGSVDRIAELLLQFKRRPSETLLDAGCGRATMH